MATKDWLAGWLSLCLWTLCSPSLPLYCLLSEADPLCAKQSLYH